MRRIQIPCQIFNCATTDGAYHGQIYECSRISIFRFCYTMFGVRENQTILLMMCMGDGKYILMRGYAHTECMRCERVPAP